MELKVVYLPVNEIKTYEKNAKIHTEAQVRRIANSIKEFGFKQPIIVDKNNFVVAGHGRLLAAKEIGMSELPCIRADDLTDEQIKAFRLADNKVSESMWDDSLLELELLNIVDLDMSNFGFGDDEEEEDEAEKEKVEKTVKAMQLRQFEHHDYVVFVFDNQMDWLNVVSEFGLERVNAGYGKTRKIGLGRVIDGTRLLEKLGNKNRDSEQGQEQTDHDSEIITELD